MTNNQEMPPSIYYNNKWIPIRYPSWLWNEEAESFVCPKPLPNNLQNFGWNEEILEWIVIE